MRTQTHDQGKKGSIAKDIAGILSPGQTVYGLGIILFSIHKFTENVLFGRVYKSIASIPNVSGPTYIFAQLLLLLGCFVLLGLANYLGEYMVRKVSVHTGTKLRLDLVRKLCKIPVKDWYRRHSAYWINMLTIDIDLVDQMLVERFVMMGQNIMSVLLGVIYTGWVSPWMMLFSVVMGILYLFLANYYKKAAKNMQQTMRQKEDACSEVFEETVHAYAETVFYPPIHQFFIRRLQDTNNDFYDTGCRYVKLHTQSTTLKNLGFSLSYLGLLLTGFLLVEKNHLPLEDMLSIWPVAVGIAYGIQSFGMQWIVTQKNLVSVDRICRLLEQKEEDFDAGARQKPPANWSGPVIECKNVCFCYPGSSVPIIKNLNLTIKPGEKVAILGPSGSGKSTLLKLLLGLYPIDQGEITLYGQNIKEYDLWDLRRQFSYLPQMPTLMNDTVMENVRMAEPKATKQCVQEALVKAHVTDVGRDDKGAQRQLGEGGRALSGGQRQRVALARCYLRDAPIYLMDEMTAALDVTLERAIAEELMADPHRTVIMVTHKEELATLAGRVIHIGM
jgi:ABC-type multidrug transport system fused ATPase/permease subunit